MVFAVSCYLGFAIIVMAVSKLQIGFILGDVTTALASMDTDRVDYQQKLETFKVCSFDSPKSTLSFVMHCVVRFKAADIFFYLLFRPPML